MSHSIKSTVSPSLDFSMGQINCILYLYGSLNALDKTSKDLHWSGNGKSKKYTRQEIETALAKLEYLHGETDDDFYGEWERPNTERIVRKIGKATVIHNPPTGRDESYQMVKEFLTGVLQNMDGVVKITFE